MKILFGDTNLPEDQANTVCQGVAGVPSFDTDWHTRAAAAAGLSGDVMLINGSDSRVFDFDIGKSYEDRGMRHDSHDAFGVTVQVPLTFGDVIASQSAQSSSPRGSKEVRLAPRV